MNATRVSAILEEREVRLSFPYDPLTVQQVKQVPGRKYDPKTRTWTVPKVQWKTLRKTIPNLEVATDDPDMLQELEALENFAYKPIIEVEGFNGTLYPFQTEACGFLVAREKALLALDMGLGKTVIAIAALLDLRNQSKVKRALIFAPKSVIPQWMTEIKKFTSETAVDITGNREARSLAVAKAHGAFFAVTNYETVLHDAGALASLKPDAMVLDESQRIGNFKAKTTKAIKKYFQPRYKWSLSGTPLENALAELHSIMDWIEPGVFGSWWLFKNEYIRYGGFKGKQIVGYRNLPRLHEQLKDWMLRRRKSEVLPDLPAVTVNTYYVQLTPEERRIYNKLRDNLRNSYILYKKSRGEETSDVLACLVYLRECCDHTALVKENEGIKASTKLQELKQILLDIGTEEKVVLFTEFKRCLDLIAKDLDCTYATLYGEMTQQDRVNNIRRFTEDPKCKVFLSTEAGGVGLNLQAASTIINFDVPWNPSKLQQRIGRCHRLGQKNTVTCINLVAKGTIEERVLQVLSEKTDLFRKVVDGDFTGYGEQADMWHVLQEEFQMQKTIGDWTFEGNFE
jgi:SNF2 family DNA or RNA helicase